MVVYVLKKYNSFESGVYDTYCISRSRETIKKYLSFEKELQEKAIKSFLLPSKYDGKHPRNATRGIEVVAYDFPEEVTSFYKEDTEDKVFNRLFADLTSDPIEGVYPCIEQKLNISLSDYEISKRKILFDATW